jgi:ABC-type ATPase involved in cell division
MPTVDVVVSTPVSRSTRCRQVEALFDVPAQEKQTLRWSGTVPLDARPWNIGLIVGPSGSGKSTVARELFRDALHIDPEWGAPSVLDDFPASVPLSEIASICQAVGFNTIPAWMRPYAVLSNGEKFRVMLARLLAECPELAVLDEFTSVVDRQVAKIGSHAVQKYIRKRGSKFVAVSCHSDIIEWLNPDWILEPATMTFSWRELQRRPAIECTISRVNYSAWRLFAPYHYMSRELHRGAQCFCLFIDDVPAAFLGIMHRPAPGVKTPIWGGSRTVTLPDYQGLGLAFVLSETVASAIVALDARFHAPPSHPVFVRQFSASPKWRLVKRPGIGSVNGTAAGRTGRGVGRMGGRPNAVFDYVGPVMTDRIRARQFLGIPSFS